MIQRRELPCALGSSPIGRGPWWPEPPAIGRAGKGLTHDDLGLALGVDVGGVDEVDAGVESPMDDAD